MRASFQRQKRCYLFSPRQRPGFLQRARRWVWPSCGWRRSASYLGHRIARVKASPHRVAAGLACGVAIGLTPLYGLQFLLAALLAALMRGSVVVSLIGTFIANPWTIPVIWLVSFEIGDALLGGVGLHGFDDEPVVKRLADVADAVRAGDMELFGAEVWPVWFAMFVGSVPLAAAGWVTSYWPARHLVRRYQEKRSARKERSSSAPMLSRDRGHPLL
ncbi:DUF2062 domain-containing protein [Constrictibacter sp. MBR-5]|uniref:DUF2062 domain-containing protein n=1 Tax=Constrictibacter sp. MBR-5 TaxID=3156467 RepID=UPI0033908882